MTHSVTWLTHTWHVHQVAGNDACGSATPRPNSCDDSLKCVPWLIRMCAMTYSCQVMTHSCVCYDSFRKCGMTHSYVCYDSFRKCDMTHSYVCCDSFLNCDMTHVATLCPNLGSDAFMCAMTQSHVWHYSFICVPRLVRTCDWTHSYVWFTWLLPKWNSFICVPWLIHTHSQVWSVSHEEVFRYWPIHMCDIHTNITHLFF